MGKKLQENFLVILLAGLAALLGFALMIYVFAADTIRTEIVAASPVRSNTYEKEELRSRDDPDYDPVYNKTKTVHETKYYRTVTVEVDGERSEMEIGSGFSFLLPGEGRHITISRNYDGSFYWEHPLRNLLEGAVLGFGGLAVIVSTLRSEPEKTKPTKKRKKKK